ncbi:PAS and helix-turn-helix domain-containing protein [Arsenophonus apicola]|uniref:LuxR C-terminal-related transcriptional regulator n=1 Tax=Arsenophonus apicola TaxID=2879119 RepID=A0ABY8P0B3_9GAMM|nr:PAS and helix-turn-helix domain-containing protein [Arsenophonus apicola]WGO82521.1 LuxR C-terminal-related transcriptional regulator [Arsenophonus apicola]
MNIFSEKNILSFMEKSLGNWCVKDINSDYIFMNKKGIDYYGFNKIDFEGKSDKEIPIERCQDLWPEFIAHDRKVIEKNKKIAAIEIHKYNSSSSANIIANYCEKTPLYDDNNKIIGVVCYGIELDNAALLHYMNRLSIQKIEFDAQNDIFSKRELEVIFWAQQRLTAKEIAKRLGISPQTVEGHLKLIYKKADVHSIFQLIEYCKHVGLDRYIPMDFIRKGVQLIDD